MGLGGDIKCIQNPFEAIKHPNHLIKEEIMSQLKKCNCFVTFLYKLVTKALPLIYERTPNNSRQD